MNAHTKPQADGSREMNATGENHRSPEVGGLTNRKQSTETDPIALLREARVWVAFVANTSTAQTNRVNAAKLVARMEAAIQAAS